MHTFQIYKTLPTFSPRQIPFLVRDFLLVLAFVNDCLIIFVLVLVSFTKLTLVLFWRRLVQYVHKLNRNNEVDASLNSLLRTLSDDYSIYRWFPNLTRAYDSNGRCPRQEFVFGILQLLIYLFI